MASIEQILDVKNQHLKDFMALPNVVGVGVGFRIVAGYLTNEISLVVNVSNKISEDELERDAIISKTIEITGEEGSFEV